MVCSQTTEPIEPKKETDHRRLECARRDKSNKRPTTKATALPQRAILPRKNLVEGLAVAPSRQTGKKTRSSRPALGDLGEYPQIATNSERPKRNVAELPGET